MPEYPIRDSILSSLNAQEPWPDNVKLFQPYEVEQILLPDNASCLAVQAFLKMCNLPFEVEMRWNAEFMSPSGRVPFIKCGAFVVSELEPIAQFAANKGVSLCGRLGTEEKAEMRAYMSLITNVLVNAELYISWLDNDTFNQVTKVRNSSVYPWPLGWLQTRAKRNNVAKRLKALHWHDKTLDQVLADVEQCCNSLSQRLGDKDYFFGTPTPLDALVYGHIRALLSAHGPKAALMIRPITTALLQHVVKITSIVGMRLTPQEEYLLHEAFVPRRLFSPTRSVSERSYRTRRSRVSVRRLSRDTISKDGLGKPFASKKLMFMSTKEGNITCKYDEGGRFGHCNFIDEDEYYLIAEIMEDIFDKVEEIILDGLHMKIEADRNGFEVIAFPNQADSKNDSKLDENGSKLDEGLETIDDVTDLSISIDDDGEEMVKVDKIPKEENVEPVPKQKQQEQSASNAVTDSEPELFDSDGVVNEVHLESTSVTSPVEESLDSNEKFHTPELTDSSKGHYTMREDYLSTIDSSGSGAQSIKSNTSLRSTPFSSESKSTLKMLSDEEISVENLLNYLRKRKATRHITNMPEVVDVD